MVHHPHQPVLIQGKPRAHGPDQQGDGIQSHNGATQPCVNAEGLLNNAGQCGGPMNTREVIVRGSTRTVRTLPHRPIVF